MITIPTKIENNYLLIPVPPQEDGTLQNTIDKKNELLSLVADYYDYSSIIYKFYKNEIFTGTLEDFQKIEGDKVIKSHIDDTITYNITRLIPNIDKVEFGKNKIGLLIKTLVINAILKNTEKTTIKPIKDAANTESETILNSIKEKLNSLDILKIV